MKRVIVESPYRGNTGKNIAYAKAAMLDSLSRGEAPFTSYLLYTQFGILNDDNPLEKDININRSLLWMKTADLVAVYSDLDITEEMNKTIINARKNNILTEFRRIYKWEESWNNNQNFYEKKLKESIEKGELSSAAFYLYPKIINNKKEEALKNIINFAKMIIDDINNTIDSGY